MGVREHWAAHHEIFHQLRWDADEQQRVVSGKRGQTNRRMPETLDRLGKGNFERRASIRRSLVAERSFLCGGPAGATPARPSGNADVAGLGTNSHRPSPPIRRYLAYRRIALP